MLGGNWAKLIRAAPTLQTLQNALQFPPASWLVCPQVVASPPALRPCSVPPTTLTRELASELAARVRRWAPAILAAAGPDEHSQAVLELEDTVSRLDHFSKPPRNLKSSYDLHTLVTTLMTAALVRNKSDMKNVILRSLEAAVLEHSRSYLKELVAQVRVPSSATLSRHQLRIDAALCCLWQQRLLGTGNVLYVWADSSPQAGVDWLLSIVQIIPSTSLIECAQVVQILAASAFELCKAAAAEDTEKMVQIAEDRHIWGSLLGSFITMHRQIPAGRGSGCTSVEHKCRCPVHKFSRRATQRALSNTSRLAFEACAWIWY